MVAAGVRPGKPGPLIVICGQTATGKTALAVGLAQWLEHAGYEGGEIICADSRTVYRGMDIGTAKPSAAERASVPHWGLDLVTPSERFTAADFKAYAINAMDDIQRRGKVPIVAGGSGLYIDSVLFDYDFRPPAKVGARQELESLSVEQLQQKIRAAGLELPNNPRNPRHLVRVLETSGAASTKKELRPHTLVFGLLADRTILAERISLRVDNMIEHGFIDEVRGLVERYSWDAPALQAPGYRAFRGYLENADSLQTAKAEFVRNDLMLAKRQKTWFKRNKSIRWLTTPDKVAEAVDIATTFLNN
jgi:tRNA dimethylallyltransferase